MINCNFESNSLLDYRDDDSVCGCHLKKKIITKQALKEH